MANIKTAGIVIRKINVGEADRILTILTRDRGKLRVVARGVRKPRAKLAGFTDMFAYNELELAEGKNFDVVTSAVTVERFVGDQTPLETIGVMYYCCELVDKLIEEQSEIKGSFELLRDTLQFLKYHDASVLLVKSYFEMKMLLVLGFVPELHKSVVSGEPLKEDKELKFSVFLGGIVQGVDLAKDDFARAVSPSTIKFMRLLKRYPLLDVAKVSMPDEILRETSAVLSDFVEQAMEVRAKSLSVMAEL
ncbi:MAG: DNA repair protein RecO [Patescibacteria group bacterium]|nr:DNA repair protein RecO [Patescibacteria group bacterium]